MQTIKAQCGECGGTGLYRGPLEWGDCAVVCLTCHGDGSVDLTYEPFEGRRPAEHIKRVFKRIPGVIHHHKALNGIKFSSGGCTYAAWIRGAKPAPVRDLYCPYLWTGQMMQRDTHPAHDQYKQMCVDHTSTGDKISRCPRCQDPNKLAVCWERFDELMAKGEQR